MARQSETELFIVVFWSPSVGKAGYRGPATSLTSENKLGKFDILAEHSNFISLIFNRLEIITPRKQKVDYEFKRGVMEVSDNLVKIFLGI